MRDKKLLWQLFRTIFTLSACTFGGGFVMVSLMKKKAVEEFHWLEEDEMLDLAALSQSSPGPILVNASVILGYRLQGVVGSLVAVLAAILPPLLLLSVITLFYRQFKENALIQTVLMVMRAGVAAVIFDVVINLAKNVLSTKRVLYIGLMVITFILGYFLHISAMVLILSCLVIGLLCALLEEMQKRRKQA